MCYKRLPTLINKKTLIQVEATLDQVAAEMKICYLQINDSDYIINFNSK